MAKGKGKKGSLNSGSDSRAGEIDSNIPGTERFSLMEYILLVLAFWALCFATMAAVKWRTGDILGLWFFFLSVGSSFTFVTICYFLYDLIYRDETSHDSSD
jgi:hypothetical protein